MTSVKPAPDRTDYALTLGAFPLKCGGVMFRAWAPRAKTLAVVLCSEDGGTFPMDRAADGVYSVLVPEAQEGSDYFLLIDGRNQRPDPAARQQPYGVHGPSRVVMPAEFPWTDTTWPGVPLQEFVLYELHVGTFTPAGTFDAAIAKLPALRELGITAVEIMPVAAFPGERNWGYDGVALFAVQDSYGGPRGLQRFVDACHYHGMACVLDVVYNHLGPEGNYLAEFAPFFTDRYKTPWGNAINFDGPHSDGVRQFFIENALHWLRDYHIDALRLDAIHSIFDFSARHILEELQAVFSAAAAQLGRKAYLIAESDLNDARVLKPRALGGYGLDAQWSDDFHHALHTAVVTDAHGYFADFRGLTDLTKALSQGFVYQGQYSSYRQRRHGNASADVPGWQLVVCTQNHDQVANGSNGCRLSTLVSFEQQKLLACVLLLAPNLPLLFMGQEFGALTPFHYFVSHSDAQLVEGVRNGRRAEFAAFHTASEFPDPQASATFLACKLDWSAARSSPHAELWTLHRDLLALRREHACLSNGRQDLTLAHTDAAERCLIVERHDPSGDYSVALFNFSDTKLRIRLPRSTGRLRLAIHSNEPRYGGSADAEQPIAVLSPDETDTLSVVCPPSSAQLYLRGARL